MTIGLYQHIVLNLQQNFKTKMQVITQCLLVLETNAGHGAGTPVSKTIEQYADIFGFTLYNMGFKNLPNKAIIMSFKD